MDEQNYWITQLRPRDRGSWYTTGRYIAAQWKLADEFSAFYLHVKREGGSEEHSTKRALRELQQEYDLDFVNDARL